MECRRMVNKNNIVLAIERNSLAYEGVFILGKSKRMKGEY